MPYRSAPSAAAFVDFAGASITGRMRQVNEDAWAALPASGVFLAADGCGGMASGRIAADLALAALERVLAEATSTDGGIEPLATAIHVANEQVLAAAGCRASPSACSTTYLRERALGPRLDDHGSPAVRALRAPQEHARMVCGDVPPLHVLRLGPAR